MTMKKALIVTLFVLFSISSGSVSAAEFAEYLPVDPQKFGIKTYEWTFGKSGLITSRIEGSEAVPYLSGDVSGARISNLFDYGMSGLVSNDGKNVKYIGYEDYYISTDCALSAPPTSAWSFSTLNNGDIIDQSTFYSVNKNNFSDCDEELTDLLLVSIQDAKVIKGNFQNAIIIWYIDKNYAFNPLNFFGKESDLGITLPTTTETGGFSLTAFEIYGFDTGTIAAGDVDAFTGNLVDLRELTDVAKPWIPLLLLED